MRRLLAVSLALAALGGAGVQEARAAERLTVVADLDDDDANGVPDSEQDVVPDAPELTALPFPRDAHALAEPVRFTEGLVRVLVDGRPIASGAKVPTGARRVSLQGGSPGRAEVAIFGAKYAVTVLAVRALDSKGAPVDFARSHASFVRTVPTRPEDAPPDPDEIRFVVVGPGDALPSAVGIQSISERGAPVDYIRSIPLAGFACPAGTPADLSCGATPLIRPVNDDLDREHPLVAGRAIRAELGGALVVTTDAGQKMQAMRVGGPRRSLMSPGSAIGPVERYRARLKVRIVRGEAGGAPPVGLDDERAVSIVRGEVERADALWAACGVTFGPAAEIEVSMVDPPKPHFVAVGCDLGLPASGGAIRFRVDGREVQAATRPGMTPREVARAVELAVRAAGFTAASSDNLVVASGAYGSTDVLIRKRTGALAVVDPPASGPVSTDATMSACIAGMHLQSGLIHFGDLDAMAGTLAERTLIKAFDDEPGTIRVFVIPSFETGGRIGESLIRSDSGAMRNVVIEDRAALRADRASFTLAHELGHVMLDDPGHPDDYGADTPTRLMDSDAANRSVFGPRRLLVEECSRALLQSGPNANAPLLKPWPFSAIPRQRAR